MNGRCLYMRDYLYYFLFRENNHSLYLYILLSLELLSICLSVFSRITQNLEHKNADFAIVPRITNLKPGKVKVNSSKSKVKVSL